LPNAVIGTMQMDSTRIAAENPASASEPKLFTTDCTSIIPMETVDCWRIEGRAIRVIPSSSERLNTPGFSQGKRRSSHSSTPKESTAEIPCAISVAHAAPATPISKRVTKTISSATLNTEEKIRKYKGILDFPRALNMDENTLYRNKKGSPRK